MIVIDMPMPRCCEYCFSYCDWGQCDITGEWIDPRNTAKKRDDNCPLVEMESGKLYTVKDGTLYEATVNTNMGGKTVTIPRVAEAEKHRASVPIDEVMNELKAEAPEFYAEVERETALLMREEGKR